MPFQEHLTPDIDTRHPVDFLEPEDEERDTTIDVEGLGKIPIDALKTFAEFLLPATKTSARWKTATIRLAALAHCIGIESVRSVSLTKIAEELECSRAILSLLSVELRGFAALAHHQGKSDTARESYSRAASAAWTRRRERVGPSATESVATAPRRSSKHPAGTEA